MKKQLFFYLIFLSTTFQVKAQSVAISGAADIRGTGCSGGFSRCINALGVNASRSHETAKRSFYLNNSTRKIVEKIDKSLITEKIEDLFEGKEAIYVEEDVTLLPEIYERLGSERPLIIARGWQQLLELDDCYIINYTLK
jgi:hypothetical protein